VKRFVRGILAASLFFVFASETAIRAESVNAAVACLADKTQLLASQQKTLKPPVQWIQERFLSTMSRHEPLIFFDHANGQSFKGVIESLHAHFAEDLRPSFTVRPSEILQNNEWHAIEKKEPLVLRLPLPPLPEDARRHQLSPEDRLAISHFWLDAEQGYRVETPDTVPWKVALAEAAKSAKKAKRPPIAPPIAPPPATKPALESMPTAHSNHDEPLPAFAIPLPKLSSMPEGQFHRLMLANAKEITPDSPWNAQNPPPPPIAKDLASATFQRLRTLKPGQVIQFSVRLTNNFGVALQQWFEGTFAGIAYTLPDGRPVVIARTPRGTEFVEDVHDFHLNAQE
jgi:hypothetical protein